MLLAIDFLISIHALREEGDQFVPFTAVSVKDFYPRPPRGGRRGQPARERRLQNISIHALREEGDIDKMELDSKGNVFLSTPSARRATLHAVDKLRLLVISIHALREEGDETTDTLTATANDISIHALREEGDWVMTDSFF